MIDSIIPFVGAHFLLGYGLAYTEPSSFLRPVLILIIVCCCLISVRSTISQSVPAIVGNEYVIGFIFHASHFLCLAKLTPPKTSGKHRWTINQLFNARWGISYIPPFSESNKKFIPSRASLFLWRMFDIVWTVSAIYILETYSLNVVRSDFYHVPNGFLRRLSEVTPREVVVRIYMTIKGLAIPYCTLRAGHCMASCLALACGDSPERWPPLFGSIRDAYTIRRWYSHFWHHLMRKAFTSHAIFTVTKILGLPRHGSVTRYLILMTTFLISALLHILANPGYEQCSIYLQLRFYSSIIGAVLVEDSAISVYQAMVASAVKEPSANGDKVSLRSSRDPRRLTKQSEVVSLHWKVVGYIWVFVVHVWATSKLMYGLYRC